MSRCRICGQPGASPCARCFKPACEYCLDNCDGNCSGRRAATEEDRQAMEADGMFVEDQWAAGL